MINIKHPPIPSICEYCSLYKCKYVDVPYCAQNGTLEPLEIKLSHECFIPAIDIVMQLDEDFRSLEDLEEIYELCDRKYSV